MFFNPRLREGGDIKTHSSDPIFCISIHASAKEATSPLLRYVYNQYDFNPRLREGGDVIFINQIRDKIFQSTPPRRRRRGRIDIMDYSRVISIHASAKEATMRRLFHNQDILDFNPRLREGGDAVIN